MDQLNRWRTIVEQRRGHRDSIESLLKDARQSQKRTKLKLVRAEQAQSIVHQVARLTQEQLTFQVSELGTLALQGIFTDPMALTVSFEIKRNRTEAVIEFTRNGFSTDPWSSNGGGAVDVAAFALRLSLWSLMPVRSVPVMLLDEPFRFLSRELQESASHLLTDLSERLGIQFIVVSHDAALIECADRSFVARLKQDRTRVEVL